MSAEDRCREELISAARALADRGLTHGTTGNVSIRLGDRFLTTPTGCALGAVEPHQLALLDLDGRALTGPVPSKEAVLHAAVYRNRSHTQAIVHTHSLHATAVSCLADIDFEDALPPLTAYYAMNVAALPLVDYCPPGDEWLAVLVGKVAQTSDTMLLRNHGPVVAAVNLADAVNVADEIEQTSRIYLLLRGQTSATLTAAERRRLFTRTG